VRWSELVGIDDGNNGRFLEHARLQHCRIYLSLGVPVHTFMAWVQLDLVTLGTAGSGSRAPPAQDISSPTAYFFDSTRTKARPVAATHYRNRSNPEIKLGYAS